MKHEEFEQLVLRIERKYEDRPLALRLRVATVIAVGYGIFLAVFLSPLLLGLACFLGAIPAWKEEGAAGIALLVIGVAIIGWVIYQASKFLLVPMEMPEGRIIKRKEAPELNDLFDELRIATGAGSLYRVVVTGEFNAGVVQFPRLGIMGWPRNVLVIGWALFDSISREEFRAVMAHEFAHLSHRHGRFSNWVYRLRGSWERVFATLEKPATSQTELKLRGLLIRWVRWFWPRFSAWSFVLSRADEYTADRVSAEIAGAPTASAALWRIDCLGRMFEQDFGEQLTRLANTQPAPPEEMSRLVSDLLSSLPDNDKQELRMQQAVARLTDHADTHPSLFDRTDAMGIDIEDLRDDGFPLAVRPSAAFELLGADYDSVRRDVDAKWREDVERFWQGRHARASSLESRLARTSQKTMSDNLESIDRPQDVWNLAQTTYDLHGFREAEPLLRRVLELRPSHVQAKFLLGQNLISEGEHDEGEELLFKLLELDDNEAVPVACDVLAAHFITIGEDEQLRQVRARRDQFDAAVEASHRERATVTPNDNFLKHGLTDEELRTAVRALEDDPDLCRAWLVRKQLTHFPNQRLFVLFVLCVQGRANWLGKSDRNRDQAIVTRLLTSLELPGRVFTFAPSGVFRKLAQPVHSVPGSLIADRLSDR